MVCNVRIFCFVEVCENMKNRIKYHFWQNGHEYNLENTSDFLFSRVDPKIMKIIVKKYNIIMQTDYARNGLSPYVGMNNIKSIRHIRSKRIE